MKLNRHGFSLVEVTLALGLAGFCLLSLLGLFGISNKATSEAVQQLEAVGIAEKIKEQMARTLSSNGMKVIGQDLALPSGSGLTESVLPCDASGETPGTQTPAKYRLHVAVYPPTSSGSPPTTASFSSAYPASILVSWPPNAPNPSGSYELLFALTPSP